MMKSEINKMFMKNRERQRRYRARKRLEAEKKKTSDSRLLPCPEGDTMKAITYIPPYPPKRSSMLYPERRKLQWKRDARRAHTFKGQEVIPLATSAGGNQAQPSSLGVNNVPLDNGCLLSGPILDNSKNQRLCLADDIGKRRQEIRKVEGAKHQLPQFLG